MPNKEKKAGVHPASDLPVGATSLGQLSAILENMNGGITAIIYDDNGAVRHAYRNKHYLEMFGYTAEQFAAELNEPYAIVVPEDAAQVRSVMEHICMTGQPATFRYRGRMRDGGVKYISCSSSLASIEGYGDKVVLSVMTDITAVVKTEQQALVFGQRLNAIMGNVNNGVVASILHDDGSVEYVFVSDKYYEILGYTREQYRQAVSDPFSLIYKEDEKTIRKEASALRMPGESKTLKYRAIRRDGRMIWLKVDISIMRFADVDTPVMLSVFEDVTASVEAEEQLRSQEARMAKLMNETPGGIAVVEADRRDVQGTLQIVYYNDSFFRFSGYTREEYAAHLQKNRMGFLFDEDVANVIDAANQVCQGKVGGTESCTVRCHIRDGSYCWLLFTGQLVGRQDNICIINMVLVDITPRKNMEDKLRVNEEMLRIAAETDRRALVTYDIKTNACYVGSSSLFSAKYGESFKNVPDSLLERGIAAPESTDELRSLFARIRAGETALSVSLRLHTGHDEYQWFACNATTVFDADGKPDKAVLVLHNITEQLLKEAVFKRWQKSIETRPPASYTLFRCNLSKDASIDQRDGELLKIQFSDTAMSFNSRTLEYAEQFIYPDDREGYITLLNSDTLLAMFYRGEHEVSMDYREIGDNGELKWRRLSVELVEYLNSTDVQAFLMYEDINEKKLAEIKAREDAESDPLTGAINRAAFASKIEAMIYSEPSKQHAILMLDMDGFKLLNDKFGHAVGDQALIDTVATLRSLVRDGDYVCRLGGDEFLVWLHDIPYDAAIAKRAQQMCEQVRKAFSHEVQITASIGIAVYPRDGHNFDMLYRNVDKALYKVKNAGKDSYAFFSAVAEPDGAEAAEEAVKAPVAVAKSRRRMLIVEDNEMNRELLSNLFKDEYLIDTAKNGEDAMIRLRHFGSAISIVLLDLIMPKMDGFEVLKRMQNNVELQAIPVIIVSGDSKQETLLKAIERGAADYVTKPVDASLIRIRVKSAVSKAENERLRAQNSYLQLQRAEEIKFHLVLESTGTVVVEYDWRNHVFLYDNTISKYIAGKYENRSLWKVFLSDLVADSTDVKTMQEMILTLANDRERSRMSKLVMLKTPSKQKHWFRVNVYKREDDFGLAEKMIITFNDVHEEVLANEKLKYQATRDELTGLYNRAGFIEKAEELIAAKAPGYYVLASLDIEKFKVINDQYGTEKGDEVLRGLARAIRQPLNSKDGICCRVMADSFAMLYPKRLLETATLVDLHRSAETLDGSLPRMKIYVGRCIVDDKALSVSALFDRATIAKETVKGRYDEYIATYDESMRTGILRQQKIISQMYSALQNGEFEVWFQPQYHHGKKTLSGAEALVRWRHPEDGLIPPVEFIPIFERNGFVYEIDKYVWEQTCAALRKWIDAGVSPVPVSVNISRYDVFRSDLVDVIKGLTAKYRLPADMLRLEITESAFSESADQIIDVVKHLIELGFTVEIDDFGSGYSSLNTLKDVPAQILKMDMRFFESSRNSRRGGNIIESVVRMAKWLGMSVIAEGVEEKEQADYLESVGCNDIQGFYYAKPMPMSEYETLLYRTDKTPQIKALETLDTLDNNEFWSPKSMETLVFNSYMGGACVFELHNGKSEVLRHNKEYEQIFSGDFAYDYSKANVNTLGYLDDDDKAKLIQNARIAISSGKAAACEICMVGASGVRKYLRVTVRMIARSGDRHLFYCVLSDITEQRMAEIKEHDMAVQLETIMENIHGGITATIFHDKNNVEIVFTNDGFYEMFGYTKEQLETELPNMLDLILPADREKTMETVERIVRERGTATYEYRCRKRDGSIIWVQVTNSVISHNSLGHTVLLAASSDVSELKRAQENELESVEKLRTVMDHAGNGITAVAMEAAGPRLLFVNDKFFEIMGYTKDGYEERTHGDMFKAIHPAEREQVREQVLSLYRLGDRKAIDYRIVKQNGGSAWIRAIVTITTLTGVDKPVQIAVFSDITEEKEASAQLRFLNESARDILAQPDSEQAINDTLQKLILYFKADRGYVVELDSESMLSRNSYEVCAEGVLSQMHALQAVPFSDSDFWYSALVQQHYFILEDTEQLDEGQAELRKLLAAQGIRSMMLAPLWRDGALIGFAGVDNPSRAINQLKQLTALSDYIAVLLTRRDLSRRIERDAEMLRSLPVRLLDNLPHGAALYRFDGKSLSVIHINKRYWALVEREPADYQTASVFGVIHPDDRDIAFAEIEAAIRQGREAMVDIRILCGKETYKLFHVVANISREADGSYLLYTSYALKAEQGMSIQEMIPIALSTMMSSSENLSYVKDKDLRYICVSQSVADMAGQSAPRELVGKTAGELFDERFAKRFDTDDASILVTGQPVIGKVENAPFADGSIHTLRTSKYPIKDASGTVIGVYCLGIDITTQREKESQLELLTNSIPGGIAAYTLADDGPHILFFNDGFYAFSGCTREEYAEAAKRDPFVFVFDEDKPVIEAAIKDFMENKVDGRKFDCVFRCHTKSGGYRWLSMQTVLSRIGEERFVINAVMLDITEQKEAENREKELLDNLPCGAGLYRFDGKTLSTIHINKQYEIMTGRAQNSDRTDYSPIDYIHPDDRKAVLDEIRSAVNEDRNGNIDIRVLYGESEYRTFHLDARIVRQDSGSYLLYVTYTRVSEQEVTLRNTLNYVFSSMMEGSTDITFAKDRNFKYICCSQAYARVLGLDDEKLLVGKSDYELFSKEFADRIRTEDKGLVENGVPIVDKMGIIPSKSGLPYYTRTSKYLLRDASGNVLGIYGIGRDITERQEISDQLKLVTDSIPGGLASYLCSPGSIKLVYCNSGFCKLFGMTREEYKAGSSINPMIHVFAQDWDTLKTQYYALMKDDTPIDCVYRIHVEDGSYKWIHHSGQVAERSGDSVVVNAVLLDITEQQEAQERLRISEELNRLAIEHSGSIITRFDVKTRTLTLPESFTPIYEVPRVLFHMPQEQIELGRVSPETAAAYTELFESIVRGDASGSAVFQQNSTKGWRWLDAQFTTVFSNTGEPVSAVISFSDITERLEKEVVYTKWQQSLAARPEDSYTLFRCNLSRGLSYDSWEGKLLNVQFDDAKETFDEKTTEYVTQCVSSEDRDRYLAFINSNRLLAEYYRGHHSDMIEYRERTVDGAERWLRLSVDLVEYPNSKDVEVYLMYENIDEQKKADLLTLERAETDPLTGVLNRTAFIAKMERALGAAKPGDQHALFMLDVDDFKQVNDTQGHGAGDDVLCQMTKQISGILRHDDLLGRLGGDEFFVLLIGIPDKNAAAKKAEQICSLRFGADDAHAGVSASMGIAMIPDDGADFDTLYKKVDAALYRRKKQGKKGYLFVTE